jgi:hypothetical protein
VVEHVSSGGALQFGDRVGIIIDPTAAAASSSVICPEVNASMAAGDLAAAAAALTVSRCTDSALATRVVDRPASIIC